MQNPPIFQTMETLHRNLSRHKEKIRAFTRKCSNSMQGVQIIHCRHPKTSGRGNENIRHGEGT